MEPTTERSEVLKIVRVAQSLWTSSFLCSSVQRYTPNPGQYLARETRDTLAITFSLSSWWRIPQSQRVQCSWRVRCSRFLPTERVFPFQTLCVHTEILFITQAKYSLEIFSDTSNSPKSFAIVYAAFSVPLCIESWYFWKTKDSLSPHIFDDILSGTLQLSLVSRTSFYYEFARNMNM